MSTPQPPIPPEPRQSHLPAIHSDPVPLTAPARRDGIHRRDAGATWNDYVGPLICPSDASKYTLSLGLATFSSQYGSYPVC